ncbi:MAG TPA: hypothetical protein VMB05_16925 [Solirubrobacteraceae bacterium]|nr:hypothetical protein [Solirubrobacteraceae bacterium]
MRRFSITSALLAVVCFAVFVTPALAGTARWAHLRSVTITIANGSLPPPYGRPHVKRFKTAHGLKRVTAALNANGIAARPPVSSGGCTGGEEVTIAISRRNGSTVRLSAYRCAGQTFGGIAGNLPKFLSAVGAGTL